jgi:hypothetical protein
MPERAWEWSKRISFPANSTVSLDWGAELWKWDASLYESREGIVAALRRAGRPIDDDSILFEATHTLVLDVVDAAGGVERSYRRLHQAMALAQETWTQWSSTLGEMPDGAGMSDPSVEDAWYTVEELLVWARTLDDRLRRPANDKRRYPDQGLIPALADSPRRDAVTRARNRLLSGGVQEARRLSGLNLHMQSLHAGSKGGRVRSGRFFSGSPTPSPRRSVIAGS